MKNKLLSIFFLFVLTTMFLSACGESEPLATNTRKTNLRFWNMMPDANVQSLDILVDGEFVTNIRYGEEQTEYSQVFSGNRNIRVTVGGNRNKITIDTLADFSNRQNQFFTFMVIDSARNNAPLLIRDNYNLRPDTLTGRFQLRVLHLSPNAPGVNIGLVSGTNDTTYIIADTLTFLRNLSAADVATQAGFRTFNLSATNSTLADTTLNLVIRAVGGGIIPLSNVRVQDKSVYTVIARGFVGGTGAQAFATRIIKDR
ncbi:MAG: DUF4397 domain-containing protein [Chloroherpetonaceae bacterium]